MDQPDYTNFHDGYPVAGRWENATIDLFIEALERYRSKLAPVNKPGNTEIEEEIQEVDWLISFLNEKKTEDHHAAHFGLETRYYRLITNLMHKYYAILHSELKQKREKVFIKGALQAEETKVNELHRILQLPLFQKLAWRDILTDDLSLSGISANKDITDPVIKQQITIQNMYAPAVFGINNGQVIQNEYSSIIKVLHDFSRDIVAASDIPENIKRDSLADIIAMQSQLEKEKPSKDMLNAGLKSLGILSNAATVITFAPTGMQYLEKLGQLLQQVKLF